MTNTTKTPTETLLSYFTYEHLPADLRAVSEPFAGLAYELAATLPASAETTVALRKLLDLEGIFAGVSAGAALAVAPRVAAELDESQQVVVLFADGGSKYMSAGLFSEPIEELEKRMEERVWW